MRPCRAAPHRCRPDGLAFGLVGGEALPDFEQGHVAIAAVCVALGRFHEAGQQARAHVGEVRGDRIGKGQALVAASEQRGFIASNERPRHRLDEAAGREKALGEPGALLDERQHRLGDARLDARQRLRLDAVDAGDTDDLFDEVGLALDVGPPGGRQHHHPVARP